MRSVGFRTLLFTILQSTKNLVEFHFVLYFFLFYLIITDEHLLDLQTYTYLP